MKLSSLNSDGLVTVRILQWRYQNKNSLQKCYLDATTQTVIQTSMQRRFNLCRDSDREKTAIRQ